MKLFAVKLTYNMVVVANTAGEAEKVAGKHVHEMEPIGIYPDELRKREDIPLGWDVNDEPFGGDDDRTIKGHLKL